jgi:hypothetical protein
MRMFGYFQHSEPTFAIHVNDYVSEEKLDKMYEATLVWQQWNEIRYSFNPAGKWECNERPWYREPVTFIALCVFDHQCCCVAATEPFRLIPIWNRSVALTRKPRLHENISLDPQTSLRMEHQLPHSSNEVESGGAQNIPISKTTVNLCGKRFAEIPLPDNDVDDTETRFLQNHHQNDSTLQGTEKTTDPQLPAKIYCEETIFSVEMILNIVENHCQLKISWT